MQPRRQHLIDTAHRLFNEHGYHATGIDWILAESGVSKATLYKHFRSKEELILAVLQQRHAYFMTLLEEAVAKARKNGQQPVLVIFDVLDAWFESEGFFGCNFIKASAEYA
ncbi:TetR/AcrR family transcriptional regulator, partial [Porticoccus sp.]